MAGAFWQTPAYAARQAATVGSGAAQVAATETRDTTVLSTMTLGAGASQVTFEIDGTGGLLIHGNALKVTSLPTSQPTPSQDWVQLWSNSGLVMAG